MGGVRGQTTLTKGTMMRGRYESSGALEGEEEGAELLNVASLKLCL